MPIHFAPPNALSRSGAMVSPATAEAPALAQALTENLHLQGTPARPGFSAQVEPLRRNIDPGDLEAAASLGDPTKLGPMAQRADVRTQVMDTPQQALLRQEQMSSNRSNQQLQTELHTAGSLVQAVNPAVLTQKGLTQQRIMNQQMAQGGGADQTGALADAQAQGWSSLYRANLMDARQLSAIDNLAARMASGGTTFSIAA